MSRTYLLLAIIAGNFVAIGAIVLWQLASPLASGPKESAGGAAEGPQPAAMRSATGATAVQIPPRPPIEVHDRSSERQVAIAKLRTQAFVVAEGTLKLLGNDPAALCLLAKLHLRSGNVDGARSLWDQALMLDPQCAEAYIDYGHYELNKAEFEKAALYFRSALKYSPEALEAHRSLGEVLLGQGDAEGAARELELFLAKAPTASVADRVSSWSQLGNAYRLLGKLDKSVHCYQQAFALDETSKEAVNGLLVAYRKLGQDQQADRYAELLKDLSARDVKALENRGEHDVDLEKAREVLIFTCQTSTALLLKSGELPAAIRLLESALDAAPELNSIRAQLVNLHVRQGAEGEAIRVLRQRCDREPKNAGAWLDLAKFCLQRRRLAAAQSALENVIALEPDRDEGYALLAQVQMTERSTVRAAVATARKAVECQPSGGNYYILATALYHAGDIEAARTALHSALELEPDNAEFRTALSRL